MAKKHNILTNRRLSTCLWIVNLLERHGALSLEEFNRYWVDNEALSDGREMERRTFYNYKFAIYDLLKVVIECDKKDGFRYKIVQHMEGDKMEQWLLRSYATNEALAGSLDIRSRVLLEDIPSGQEYLGPVMEAMKANRKISFVYQRFNESGKQTITNADPYCVKLYHQRWYVLVKEQRTLLVSHEKIEEMHVYSLDRILSLTVEEESFVMDKDFDGQEYFRFAFGTRVERGNPPCRVRLKVQKGQCPYLRTLPLHPSQREVETTEDYSVFELDVAITVELIMQILYYGSLIEVLGPEELRDAVGIQVYKMAESYGFIEPPTEEDMDAMREDIMNHPELYDKKYPPEVYNCERMDY